MIERTIRRSFVGRSMVRVAEKLTGLKRSHTKEGFAEELRESLDEAFYAANALRRLGGLPPREVNPELDAWVDEAAKIAEKGIKDARQRFGDRAMRMPIRGPDEPNKK